MLCSFMGGVSFGGRSQRPRFGLVVPEGYTACSPFTHPLRLPRASRRDRFARRQKVTVDDGTRHKASCGEAAAI